MSGGLPSWTILDHLVGFHFGHGLVDVLHLQLFALGGLGGAIGAVTDGALV